MADMPPRVAIVTGSESGIGRATAVALARQGRDVGITWYRDEAAGEATAEEVRALGRRAEVRPLDLTTVAQACRDTERLEFAYTAGNGVCTERLVEPFRLVALGRRWYLVAYDVARGDWRSFRRDRLAEPRTTGARFAPRPLPADDAAAFVRAGTGSRQQGHAVEVLVRAPVDEVQRRIGQWSTVEEAGAGTSRVRMDTDDLGWPALALGMVGAEFTVLSPPELRELLGDWGGRFARAAAEVPTPA